ncbi:MULTISPECIES: phosphopantetheine-binding protein [unclassified Streptosporangium]|uniref:phosphopantetheine-binding protein n=1 Tax=unclassified Streptosporangium TaxID=2632669 RepID=UPI002E2AD49A|nr:MULTISPECIES: phosphopantetheine-binding protein [unclassified Streptosporangium]
MSLGFPEHLSFPEIQKKIEEIWTGVLGVPEGQEGAPFFELGGESVGAARIVARVEDELGVWIEVGDIFEDDPTMAEFVRTVAARANVAQL